MKKININKKNIIIISLVSLTIIIAIIALIIVIRPKKAQIVPNTEETETSKLQAHNVYDKNTDLTFLTVDASKSDHSGILVKEGAIVTLRDSSIKKYNGPTSIPSKSEEIGLNSAIAVSYGSQLKITNSKIESTVEYVNGIYASGQKTKVSLIDSEIKNYAVHNNGAVVATSATLELEHTDIITKYPHSPAILVKSKYGNATLNNSMLETNGSSSPLFKSSGTLTIENSTGTANGSRFAVLTGGKLTIKNTTLISAGASNDDEELASGFLIRGKEPTDIVLKDSSLNINSKLPYYKTAILFNILDSTTTLSLTKTQLNYGSNKILKMSNSEVNINCSNQTFQGDIELDNKSKLTINLKENSLLMGEINNNQNNNIIINIDDTSKIILIKDLYIKELNNKRKDNSNINFNNHKLYVNGEAIN